MESSGRVGVEFLLAGFCYVHRSKHLYAHAGVPILGPVATAANIPKSTVRGVDFGVWGSPAPALDALAGGTLRFPSKSYSDLVNSGVSTIPSYALFDARAGSAACENRLGLALTLVIG